MTEGISEYWQRAVLALAAVFVLACGGDNGGGDADDDTTPGDDSVADDDVDDDASDDPDDDADDDSGPPLALYSVAPTSGGASVPTGVTLSGDGFGPGLTVTVGDVPAESVVVVSATVATAVFPPVELADRGKKDVRAMRAGQEVVLPDGFEYLFDEDPIVFVHGYLGDAADWDRMIERFIGLGYPEDFLAAVDYEDDTGSNVVNARDELAPFVEEVLARTGAAKVDLVAHSMGGLSSRLYIQQYGGEHTVRDYVSLAATHHGNGIAWMFPFGEGARELVPAYAEEDQSVNHVQWDLNGDPDSADVDETPFGVEDGGEIHWMGALISNVDVVVVPASCGCLNQRYRDDCEDPINVEVRGVGHIQMVRDEGVFEIVQGLIRQHNLSRP